MNASHQPHSVTWLAYGGLIPFVALALAGALNVPYHALLPGALVAYGAVILSFVGALHWGFAMVHPAATERPMHGLFLWSVLPSLIGWLALLVPTHAAAATLLIAGFLAHYRQDLRLARAITLPAWYLPLRLQLTVVACLCLASLYFLRA
ncbi:MAG: DUF3429 domain-containing protein [Polaromonas sp.]|nr:DUF3429 domain-containing protein [Polaromonas sp.]